MTDLSREILRDWQVRKTKAQKLRFIDFMQSRLPGLRVEEGGLPRCRNLVLGDIESADVVFTAHYDTCAGLPFPNFITPKNLLIYLLYQLLIMLPFFVLGGLLGFVLARLGVYPPGAMMLSFFLAMGLRPGQPPHRQRQHLRRRDALRADRRSERRRARPLRLRLFRP